jgi:hypothetical protein
MRVVDPNFTTKRSKYARSYLCSSTWLKSRHFADKCDKYGPSTFTAICTYLLHPHLGPPAFSV